MEFISTSGRAPTAHLEEALLRGMAPDGGLYVPAHIPKLAPSFFPQLPDMDWPVLAGAVTGTLLGESMAEREVSSLTAQALDFPVPLVQLRERVYLLELFRGPTLAFKDVGARFMAHLLSRTRESGRPPLTVLTATSGDTGGAVAQAFHGLPGLRVVVLFPHGKVTPRQERQFSTLGGNVVAVAVRGDFDDCQRLAKEAFATLSGTQGQVDFRDSALTSANSINVGRFLPQATYFFEAWARIRRKHENRMNILFSVPSGNFGNLAAGLLAKSMGLTGVSFLAATNRNAVVPRFLETGRFQPEASIPTLSTAMDVGNPSNLSRILHLYRGSLDALRRDLVGRSVTDAETLDCIRRVHRETGYVMDPHSAVGLAAAERELEARPESVAVVLGTAHPAKFAEVVEPVIGETLPVPVELSRCLQAERKVLYMDPELGGLREILDSQESPGG